ncbi:hypothetical protein [Nitrosovibrio sp. Nv17]|uniref:hypothetical protein n=1 Tax=Nitrosovibrio sp. Nv17 TaxID=1855339 RepID=UPI00090910F0|nr:hypothetical protein [Nitrosovibrio sp. Nv17]SFW22810.1 CRISPR-associated protein Csx10 [Nitrosovibrio sp. Nv17]
MIYHYLPYTLSLRAPAVLTSLGDDPNSSRTLPFVPGSALRGAAARGLGDPGSDADRLERFRAVFLSGGVCFLNAYPRAGGRRTLPTPVSLHAEKNGSVGPAGEISAWDLSAFSNAQDDAGTSWPEAALMPLPDPFVSIGGAQPLRVSPARTSRVHQQRDRARGRAWKEERKGREEAHGAIFSFESLDEGQEFDGLIQFHAQNEAECDALVATIKNALPGPVLLGRSRRAGYGGDAAISWSNVRTREVEGTGLVSTDLPVNIEFRALLASACVTRDPETGQIDPTQTVAELVERFAGRVEVIARRWAFELVGGFNRKWRLEIPQALACAAGSVLVLRTTAPIPFGDLLAIENAGLGERRAEGFGRVVFIKAPTQSLMLRKPSASGATTQGGDVPELVRFAEGRIVDAALERAIQEHAARIARNASRLPAPSLLGRLRTALRAEPSAALATLRTWLGQDGPRRLKRPAMDQLERCRVDDGERLAAWLRKMIDGTEQVLVASLRLDALVQRAHVVSEVTARAHWVQQAPWIRARLIDATLASLARRQRQRRSP